MYSEHKNVLLVKSNYKDSKYTTMKIRGFWIEVHTEKPLNHVNYRYKIDIDNNFSRKSGIHSHGNVLMSISILLFDKRLVMG